jgi:hypothetical protein
MVLALLVLVVRAFTKPMKNADAGGVVVWPADAKPGLQCRWEILVGVLSGSAALG